MVWFYSKEEVLRARKLLCVDVDNVASHRGEGTPFSENLRLGFLAKKLEYAGLDVRTSHQIFVRIGAYIFSAITLAFMAGNAWLVLLASMPALLELANLNRKAFKRAEGFERDYSTLLMSLASSVRTGLDPLVALCEMRHLFSEGSEMKQELIRLSEFIEKGGRENEAIALFAATIMHPDIQLFKTAFIIARKEGSSLASCLQRLAKVTRTRQSFRRKIRTSVAMQKLSVFGIAGCAIIIGLLQCLSNLQVVLRALAHPLGFKALVFSVSLIVLGLTWMLNLAKSRI